MFNLTAFKLVGPITLQHSKVTGTCAWSFRDD